MIRELRELPGELGDPVEYRCTRADRERIALEWQRHRRGDQVRFSTLVVVLGLAAITVFGCVAAAMRLFS